MLKCCQIGITGLPFLCSAAWNTLPTPLCLPSQSLDGFRKHIINFCVFEVAVIAVIIIEVHYAGVGDGMTESLSETGMSLSQLITIGHQLQQNLTQLLVSI